MSRSAVRSRSAPPSEFKNAPRTGAFFISADRRREDRSMPLIVALVVALMMGGAPIARADSAQDAKAAVEAFDRQDFKTAITLLGKALEDKSLNTQARSAVLAYRGGAHYSLGEA